MCNPHIVVTRSRLVSLGTPVALDTLMSHIKAHKWSKDPFLGVPDPVLGPFLGLQPLRVPNPPYPHSNFGPFGGSPGSSGKSHIAFCTALRLNHPISGYPLLVDVPWAYKGAYASLGGLGFPSAGSHLAFFPRLSSSRFVLPRWSLRVPPFERLTNNPTPATHSAMLQRTSQVRHPVYAYSLA